LGPFHRDLDLEVANSCRLLRSRAVCPTGADLAAGIQRVPAGPRSPERAQLLCPGVQKPPSPCEVLSHLVASPVVALRVPRGGSAIPNWRLGGHVRRTDGPCLGLSAQLALQRVRLA
jgi:hypothetical protein